MTGLRQGLVGVVFFGLISSASGNALAATLHVATSGSDAGPNNCLTAASPCLTIGQAIAQAASGDTIKVAKGNYTLTAALAPGAKNLTFEGGYDTADSFAAVNVGVRGTYMTRLIAAASSNIFLFDTAGNTSTVKNFVLQGNGTFVVYGTASVSPTIENNVIMAGLSIGIFFNSAANAPVVRNNIVVETSWGIDVEVDAGTVTNNTVVNATSAAFYGATRKNNLAYAGQGMGFQSCSAVSGNGSVTYSLAYRNGTNFESGNCSGGTGKVESPPRFLNLATPGTYFKNANGISEGLTGTVLTDNEAAFPTTNGGLAGYFVTPDLGRSPRPQYFLIVSNTATTLTVVTGTALTSYGAVGRPYAITDFTSGTNNAVATSGNAASTPDIYGTARTATTVGAVAAQGTSLTSPSTYYIAAGGTDSFGAAATCNSATGTPCKTINYLMGIVENGDTIKVAKGTHTLTYAIQFGDNRNVTIVGGYDETESPTPFTTQNLGVRGTYMTRLIAAASSNIFLFDTAGNTSTVKNFVLQGDGTFVVYGTASVSPTIENNIIMAGLSIGIIFSAAANAPVVRNNVVIETSYGIDVEVAAGTVTNNTVVNAMSVAFYGATRTNNLAYAGDGTGFQSCSAVSGNGSVTYSLAYRNGTNFESGNCSNGAGKVESPPRFLNLATPGTYFKNANGISEGLTGTVLTDNEAAFPTTNGGLAGYFVTPDLGRSPRPQYFLIVSNTATTLTVATGTALTSYGTAGRPYAITDFTSGTNNVVATSGNAASTPDIYGTARTATTVGAVAAQGTSLTSPSTYYIAAGGTDSFGAAATCNSATGTPCKTINYLMGIVENGDTIKAAKGTYTLTYPIQFVDNRNVTIVGGYDESESPTPFTTQNVGVRGTYMTRLIAAASSNLFLFDTAGNTSTVKNFVLQGNGNYVVYGNASVSPTIENNIIMAGLSIGIFFSTAANAPVVRNNVVIETNYGIDVEVAAGTVTNNTVVNATGAAFYGAARKNNIAYAGGTGFDSCSGVNATFSDSSANTTAFGAGCDGGSNLQVDPQFSDPVLTASTGLTATTLTKTGAGWTANQWAGYFVTPDTADAKPQYFLIVSNTADTLTVATGGSLLSYGAAGDTFRITDFTLKSGSGIVNVGTNTGAPATDIYGISRPQQTTTDMGATEFEPLPSITINDVTVTETESNVNAVFTVSLSSTYSQGVTVDYATANGTAASGADYTAIPTTQLSFSSTETTKTVTVTVLGDSLDETNETYFVNLANAVNATIVDSQGQGTVNDNDATPTVQWTASSQASANESGTMTVTAQLSAASGQTVTVPYTVTGTATGSGTDYSITASPLTITAGQTQASATITITADSLDEANETVIVTMGSPTNATQGATTLHTATITDDDNPPTVSWTASSQSSANESGTMTVTAQLSATSGLDVTVPFSVTGTATGSGTDYSITASPIAISAGSTTGSATITITADTLDEANETVIVTMGAPTNASQGATTVHTATITDDDPPPTVTLSLNGSPMVESNSGVATVTATLSAASGLDITVNLAFSGTATGGGTDYTASGSSIPISAGGTTGTITLTGVTDQVDEDNETAIVDISSVINGTESGTQQVTATVTDDDTAGVTVTPSGGSTTVTEGGATDTYTIVLTSEPTQNVVIALTTGADIGVGPSSLTFTPPNWNVAQTVTVTAVDDAIAEGNHADTVTYGVTSTDSKYSGLSVSGTAVTVTDNDAAGVSVVPSGGSTNVTEGGATDTYTIVLTSEPTANVTVTVASSTQATASPSPLVFTSANWNAAQTVSVTAVNDSKAEGNHTTTLTHSASGADAFYSGIGINNIQVDIVDNDTAGVVVTQSDGSTTVTEGGATDTYTVALTSEPVANVTVDVSFDGQVTVAPASVTFTPQNWNAPQTLTVTAVDDGAVEGAHASTLVHKATGSDAGYNGVSVASVVVAVLDESDEGKEEPPGEEPPPEEETVVAMGGPDRTMTSGRSLTLDGGGSESASNVPLTYLWEIVSGQAVLSDPFSPVTVLTALPEAGAQTVTVRLTVTSPSGTSASDLLTVQVFSSAGVSVRSLGKNLRAISRAGLIYEDRIRIGARESVFLTVGASVIQLPEGAFDYSLGMTRDKRLMIGLPGAENDSGRVYFSRLPVDALPEFVRLEGDTASFMASAGNQPGDGFGRYLTAGDLDGDGREEMVVAAPGASSYGVAYVYDSEYTLTGTVFGGSNLRVGSLAVGRFLQSGGEDLYFGPAKSSLTLVGSRETTTSDSGGFILKGSQIVGGSVDLEVTEADVAIGSGASFRSAALGDLNRDGRSDLVQVSETGRIYVFFARSDAKILATEEADVVIDGTSTARFGERVAIGDVTGDGVGDLVISAPDYGERGAVFVIFGGESWARTVDVGSDSDVLIIEGTDGTNAFGSDLVVEDTDGDGMAEIYTIDDDGIIYQIEFPDAAVETEAAGECGGAFSGAGGCWGQAGIKSSSGECSGALSTTPPPFGQRNFGPLFLFGSIAVITAFRKRRPSWKFTR